MAALLYRRYLVVVVAVTFAENPPTSSKNSDGHKDAAHNTTHGRAA
jgi:hypothetical protein